MKQNANWRAVQRNHLSKDKKNCKQNALTYTNEIFTCWEKKITLKSIFTLFIFHDISAIDNFSIHNSAQEPIGKISREEIRMAVKVMESMKAAGIDASD